MAIRVSLSNAERLRALLQSTVPRAERAAVKAANKAARHAKAEIAQAIIGNPILKKSEVIPNIIVRPARKEGDIATVAASGNRILVAHWRHTFGLERGRNPTRGQILLELGDGTYLVWAGFINPLGKKAMALQTLKN